jgi:hypothetical protein
MQWIIVVFGIIFLFKLLLGVCKTLFKIFYPFIIGRPRDLKLLAGSNWAGLFIFNIFNSFLVVTGSTDGIGKG